MKIPGPGNFAGCNKGLFNVKKSSVSGDREIRNLGFISQAQWHSAQSPGPAAKKAEFDPKFSLVEERNRKIKIAPVPKPNPNAALTAAALKPLGPGQYKEVENGQKYLAKTEIVHMIAK